MLLQSALFMLILVGAGAALDAAQVDTSAGGPPTDDGGAGGPWRSTANADRSLSGSVNDSRVEDLVFERLDALRSEDSGTELARAPDIATAADEHAEWLAETEQLTHTGAGGSTPTTRYRACRSTGEVAAQTWVFSDARVNWADHPVRHESAEGVAHGLVEQWKHSPGHNEIIRDTKLPAAGVGVAIRGDKVYAVVGYCRPDWVPAAP